MSRTIDVLIRELNDLPNPSRPGMEITVRGAFDARMMYGGRAGASHEESAALAAAAFEPEMAGPRPGAFVSREGARDLIQRLIESNARPDKMTRAESERVAQHMARAVAANASPESAVWWARLAPAPFDGLVVVGGAYVWTVRLTAPREVQQAVGASA